MNYLLLREVLLRKLAVEGVDQHLKDVALAPVCRLAVLTPQLSHKRRKKLALHVGNLL
jgi:hypothetical protein